MLVRFITGKGHCMSQDKEMKKNNNFGKMKGYFVSQIIGGRAGSSWRCDKRWDVGMGTFIPWKSLNFLPWIMENQRNTIHNKSRISPVPFLALLIFHFLLNHFVFFPRNFIFSNFFFTEVHYWSKDHILFFSKEMREKKWLFKKKAEYKIKSEMSTHVDCN